MDRICIIGSGGSGKSTLANKLGCMLSIPVFHLDTYFWKPGWQEPSKAVFVKNVNKILSSNDKWVIDGNYSGTFYDRFEASDTIIFLDYKRSVCFYGIFKRYFKYKGKTRPDLPEGCNESIDFKFYKWVWNFPKAYKPGVLKVLELFKDRKKVLIFKNRKETKKFLERLT